MNPDKFLSDLMHYFDKDLLTPQQEGEYIDRILRIRFEKRQEWYKAVIDKAKRWPSVAELLAIAADHGLWSPTARELTEHIWEKTDCWACAGSGMIQSFWTHEFDGEHEQMRLMKMMPYLESTQTGRDNPNWATAIFRCSCECGEAQGLPKWPRWSENQPAIRRLSSK